MTEAMKKSNRPVSKKEGLHFKVAAVKLEMQRKEGAKAMKKKIIAVACAVSMLVSLPSAAFAEADVFVESNEETDVAVSEFDGIENSTKESYDKETDLSETQFSESETEFEESYQTDDTEYETESEVETETELDSYYADDPQYGKEMQKEYGISLMSAKPQNYVHNSRYDEGYQIHYGVDVSSYQKDIDWAKAKADGVEFAIIRAAYRGWGSAGNLVKDTYIKKNIEGAKKQGIKVGVYIYSQAITNAEAKEEVDFVIDAIQGYSLDLPLVMDFEYAYVNNGEGGRLYDAHLSKDKATEICMTFCKYAESLGYDPMVYANKSTLSNNLNASTISSKYKIWLAHYTTQSSYSGAYDFWQYSETIHVNGIPEEDGKGIDGDFWYEKVQNDISIKDYNVPERLFVGDSFDVQGTVSSKKNLTSVTVGIYNKNGDLISGKTVNPNAVSYDISQIKNSIMFDDLDYGMYYYKVIAKNEIGTETVVKQSFAVLGHNATIDNGTYYIGIQKDNGYVLSVDNNKNTEGANIMLWTKADHEYRKFAFTYEGGGYYSIKNIGSGKYLSVNQESGKSGANVQQSDYKMLWYIIPDEDGYCYILPKSSSTSCLDLTSGTVQKGQNIEIWKYNMGSAQKWQLESVSETSKTVAKISGQTLPDNQTEGASFSIRGKITSDSKITSVKVGIYNTSGETVIGKNVAPNAQSYDLKNLDTSVKFGNLTAGIYRYRVTAANSAGTATLIDKRFAVYKDGQTISIGTYYISIAENTDYALSVDNDKNTSGTNILLWTKADYEYRKFEFSYAGDGYYKIKNVGSGQYLAVTGQSGVSGTNVEQSSTAALWRVLPDGTGSYYLLPDSSSTSCLDLAGGTVQKGQNIEIWQYNMGKAQRWKLQSASSTAKTTAKITGQTQPQNQKEGTSFSIRGEISSDSNLTSVKVGVYDTNGTRQIGKKVNPNAKKYDLKNLDTSIKFGNLTAGVYQYKVTATNSAGTVTLVNKRFAVYKEEQTITAGIYYICSAENTEYALSVDSNKNTSGANILLWTKADNNYRKFAFSYAGEGCYKIKNVGSGKYLSVTGQSGNSGANVEQSSTAALWRVLPDGTGSYYLLPKNSSTSCLDLTGGTAQKGQNIEIWQYNMGKAQRWKLAK